MDRVIREEDAHWSKRLFHGWIGPLIRAGQLRPVELSDLAEKPPPEDAVEQTSAHFRRAFRGSVVKALVAAFKARFIKIFCYLIVLTCLNLLRPLILSELIGRLTPATHSQAFNLFSGIDSNIHMACLAISTFFILALIRSHFLRHCFKLTWSMPGLLRTEVYNRLIYLEHKKRVQITSGEFVNIATRDCDSASLLPFLLEPLLYPITVIAYCLMLTQFLGPWALLAVAVLVAVVPLGRHLERRMSTLAAQIREQSKIRLGILGEILAGMKVIKFHAWEQLFTDKVMQVRNKEVGLMRSRARVAARHSALSALLPILTGASIVTWVSWIEGVPSTAHVFASFSIIATLVTIFSEVPDLLQSLSELKISLSRVGDFLSKNSESPNPPPEPSPEDSFTFKHASFRRHPSDPSFVGQTALTDINLTVQAGQCVAIVGSIGSGKSTLLSAILGELETTGGEVDLPHPISTAPQIPWNQNATVRDNITFQLPLHEPTLEQVIWGSSLMQDIKGWPGGINTEVGERGVNLSGGQKQRLALARSAYACLQQNIRMVLWDDPFSALDESVATHVFEHLLLRQLSHTTRVFCTHRIDFALRSDWVVVMDNGRIIEQGLPQQLLAGRGAFHKLHDMHLSTRGHQLTQNQSDAAAPTSENTMEPADSGQLTTEEQITLPVFNKKALGIYVKALAPAVGLGGIVAVFMLPRITDIGSNLWLGHWTSHPSEVELSTAVGVFAGLTLITVIAERTRSVLLFDGGVKAGTRFFSELLTGVMNAPMRFFDTSPLGRVLNRFTSDTNAVDNSMPSSVGQFLTSVIGVLISLLPVVVSQPATLVLLAPVTGLYFGLFRWVRKAQLRLNALTQVVRSPWMSLTSESLPGLSVIQSLQVQERFLKRYAALVNRHISTGFYVIATNLWFAFRLEILGVALVGGFIILLTLNPDSASTTLKAVGLTFALQTIGLLGGIARSLRMLENNLISVDRVAEYSHLTPEQNTPHADTQNWPNHGEIRMQGLTASYSKEQSPVLKDVTLTLKAKSKVGIVGRTGSGKSSLFLAITRILPIDKNMIFIDGVDIATLPLKQLRQAIAMIPQDPVLFSGSLRENLDPFQQHDEQDITTALRRAHLQHICRDAAAAQHYTIEENGRNLSVGERQLVCLARALLSRAKILLIDEATANVDVVTDALIQQTLREEFSDCTQLVIAHRTNTLKDVDLLIRLDDGRVIASH